MMIMTLYQCVSQPFLKKFFSSVWRMSTSVFFILESFFITSWKDVIGGGTALDESADPVQTQYEGKVYREKHVKKKSFLPFDVWPNRCDGVGMCEAATGNL